MTQSGNGHDDFSHVDVKALKALVRRIETRRARQAEASSEVGLVYQEAERDGHHRKVLKEMIKLRAMEPAARADYRRWRSFYERVLGIWEQGDLFEDEVQQHPDGRFGKRMGPRRNPLDDWHGPAPMTAQDLGEQAALAGKPASANPFSLDIPEREEWRTGWLVGYQKLYPTARPEAADATAPETAAAGAAALAAGDIALPSADGC
jgi:uncharacterized protein (UPF0335 family)